VIRPSASELTDLLAPFDIDAFIGEYWGQQPLHIPGRPSKFDSLHFDLEALEGVIRAPAGQDRARVRFVGRDDKVHEAPDDLSSFSVRDGDLTVCADAIDGRFDELAAYCASIKASLSLAGPVFMTCYASPGGQGFGMHWDCQPSFVMQLQGSKRWRFSAQPAVAWPPVIVANAAILENVTEHYPWLAAAFPGRHDHTPFVEQVLTAGDVLYLPAGTWHEARAMDDISLALTMACTPCTAADLIVDVLRGHLSSSEAWRAAVPPSTVDSSRADGLPPAVAQFLEDRLRELREHVRSLTVEDLQETWVHHVASSNARTSAPGDAPCAQVVPSDLMTVADGFPVRYVARPSDRVVSVYRLDHRIDLDHDALPLVSAIVEQRSFRAGAVTDWIEGCEWPDVEPVLTALVQAGILNAAGADGASPLLQTRPTGR
jgi:ribosomal protein L16 Arg81 hydroxylase